MRFLAPKSKENDIRSASNVEQMHIYYSKFSVNITYEKLITVRIKVQVSYMVI